MHIRKFKPEDAKRVSEIIKNNLMTINSATYSDETITALLKENTPERLLEKSQTYHFYVAVEDDTIIGIGGYKEDDVHTCYVDPSMQGKGIGKQVVQRVLRDAKEDGIKAN